MSWAKGKYGKSLYPPFHFAVILKSTKKIAFYKKQTTHFFCVKLIKRCQNSFLGRHVVHDFQIPL